MHNGEPQFSKRKFSVPTGSNRVSQKKWDQIWLSPEESAAKYPAKRQRRKKPASHSSIEQ